MRIKRTHEQQFIENRDAAVVAPAADPEVFGQLVLVAPVLAPGGRVERDHVARRFGNEHHAVDDQRHGLGAVNLRDLVGPLQLEAGDVSVVHLVEAAVPLAIEGAGVHQPILRFVRGVQQTLPRHR